jgi:hypothetical protein
MALAAILQNPQRHYTMIQWFAFADSESIESQEIPDMPRKPIDLEGPQVRALLEAVKSGVPRGDACSLAGLSHVTLRRWIALGTGKVQGEPHATPERIRSCRELVKRLKLAEGEAVQERVKVIRSAGQRTWLAAAWWLERRRKRDFGKASNVDQSPIASARQTTAVNVQIDLAPYISLMSAVLPGPAALPESGEGKAGVSAREVSPVWESTPPPVLISAENQFGKSQTDGEGNDGQGEAGLCH